MAAYEDKVQSRVTTLKPREEPVTHDRELEPPVIGIQKPDNAKPLRSGTMKGCHLIMGINPKNSQDQFIAHINLSSDTEDKVRKQIWHHPEWHYYLFITEKTKLHEHGKPSMSLDEFVSYFETMIYQIKNGTFLKAFHVDDMNMNRVEVEYRPKTGELIIEGIREYYDYEDDSFKRNAVTFQANIDIPPDLNAFKKFIEEEFQDKGWSPVFHKGGKPPAGVKELCEATDLEAMRKIAARKISEWSFSRDPKTQKLYEVIADPKNISFYDMKQELLNIESKRNVPRMGTR